MTSWSNSVEDPEKHFLGNLLDDETSFSASPPPRVFTDSTIPTTSVISSVGPILASTDGPSRHWPEPPPPYTPNKQSPLPSPWAQVEQAAESGVHFNDLLGLKEPSTWGSLLNFSGAGFGASGSQQKPTEIHHHQHTHQHTHVLQVINKHHYGSPDSLHYDAPPAPFSSVVRKAATPEIKRPTHLTPHSAPVVHKMPFSYRDVAARKEVHSNGHSPTQIIRKATPSGELETKLEPARSTESIPAETEAIRNGKDTKTKADQEFQKISRKKGAKEKRAMSDSSAPVPVKELQKPKMDLPTRYQVLEKLSSPKIVKTDSVDSDDAVFAAKAEKIEKIDDPDHSPPRAKKNIIPERKKSSQPPSSKKRAPRKRNESDSWILRFIWNYICLFVEGLQDGLKWLMVLVVDVCSRSGELFLFAMQSVYECFMDFLHGIGQYVLGSVLSVFYTCRQLSLRQMFLSQPTDAVWGLDENMALPTTTEEALERLLRVRRVDAYAILGLRSDCTEDEILRHHARLQTLLNVEKTPMEGMEEAENLVETAFALIQTPDMREDYNHHNFGKNSLHNDLLDFWDTLRMKIEESRHTMLCDCGKRHARIPTPIKVNEARYCKRCGIKHPARLNDLWCETRLIGLAYLYYTCSDGVIYDISEWASCECQTSFLKHMKPNAHVVQYRLVSPGNLHVDRNTQALQDFLEDNSWATNSDSKNIRAKAQAYRPMEPRDEDRSRRAANRRQKRR